MVYLFPSLKLYVYVCLYVCMYVRTYIRTYVYIYIYIYHIYMYIYTYIYIIVLSLVQAARLSSPCPCPTSAPARRTQIRSISEISLCFFGPRPWHVEIRHRVKKTSTIKLFGFETLKLKIRRLKLWKPTVMS